ncbi:MAG: thiamine-phosphate kinase [Alistipes sp.]|nr:thiamine-phosphate kinase [Candidatus Alistipes equi]
MEQKKTRTEIKELGQFALIDTLTSNFRSTKEHTIKGVGDDAAVISISEDEAMLLSTDMMIEGIDFDLTYFPPKHLGYKVVTRGISDIVAMNAIPEQITISIGVSAKISVEVLRDFYQGVRFACEEAEVDLVGGDTSASVTGFVINITAVGRQKKNKISYRSGAKKNDLICLTGNLGAAYMGLRLLQRERYVLSGGAKIEPKFEGYEYLLEKYLKPRARYDVVDSLEELGLVPTSMIDVTDGLSSELLQIAKASSCGVRIYLDRIPLAKQTNALADEMNLNSVTAAMNGGEDYELIFTLPLEKREEILGIGQIDIIGHITDKEQGCVLVTSAGDEIKLEAQGFNN